MRLALHSTRCDGRADARREAALRMQVGVQQLRRYLSLSRQPATWKALATDTVWHARALHDSQTEANHIATAVRVGWPRSYQHRNAGAAVRPLLQGFRGLAPVECKPIPQPYEGIVLFDVEHYGTVAQVAIDYFDATELNARCLSHVSLYFKFQYRRGGYGRPDVVPGGYVEPKAFLYRHTPRLRQLRSREPRCDVFGRFGLRYGADVRRDAITRLSQQRRFGYAGGTRLVPYGQALREAARAKVVVDLPGNGPFCYRLVDYLAIGCCIVAYPHRTTLPVPLEPGRHLCYVREDLADLVDVCASLVLDDDRRDTIGRNAACYFDDHLHYHQLAKYYLGRCLRLFSPTADESSDVTSKA